MYTVCNNGNDKHATIARALEEKYIGYEYFLLNQYLDSACNIPATITNGYFAVNGQCLPRVTGTIKVATDKLSFCTSGDCASGCTDAATNSCERLSEDRYVRLETSHTPTPTATALPLSAATKVASAVGAFAFAIAVGLSTLF